MLALAGTYPTVYVDTSASEPARYPEEFVEFLRGGAGRAFAPARTTP
jgi:hypothetical protein